MSPEIREAFEGARDHGKFDGTEGTYRNMRPPSVETLQKWFVRVLQELDDQSMTVHEFLEELRA